MSPLDPQSEPARRIATLWWVMLAVAAVVFGGVCVMLLLAWFRRSQRGLPIVGERERLFDGSVVVFGIVIPLITVVGLFVWANVVIVKHTDSPPPSSAALTIQVTSVQWWWRVRYPGTEAVTANEIHIPTKTPVTLTTQSEDVIHSLWVPRLNRKIDSLPGRVNRLSLNVDKPGIYLGQCAEFCGLQHANMRLLVRAESPERFRAWLAKMSRPRPAPATRLARKGERVFAEKCSSCHTIRGTPGGGTVGPDLTHLKTRKTLAARTIPNNRGHLAGWVVDPQNIKEGAKMPALNLEGPELQALLEYLESSE